MTARGNRARPLAVASGYAPIFWSRVAKADLDSCWPWTGYKSRAGYGHIRIAGLLERAHRVAYVLTHGPLADNVVVRHSCDNPPCCNPAHLLPGSDLDNARDRDNRHRRQAPTGEAHGRARLTIDDVRTIRASTLSIATLARHYNVGESTVRHIRQRTTWKDV